MVAMIDMGGQVAALRGEIDAAIAATLDSGYLDGTRGLLTTSDGKKTDLTSGMSDSIKKQACDFVLIQGQSML